MFKKFLDFSQSYLNFPEYLQNEIARMFQWVSIKFLRFRKCSRSFQALLNVLGKSRNFENVPESSVVSKMFNINSSFIRIPLPSPSTMPISIPYSNSPTHPHANSDPLRSSTLLMPIPITINLPKKSLLIL